MKAVRSQTLASIERDAIRIVETADIARLRPQWQALFQRSLASPFQSFEWLSSWACVFKPETLWILQALRGDDLIGLVPLYLWTDPASSRRQLTLLGNGVSDHLDLIAAPQDAAPVARAFCAHLSRCADRWDLCDFRDLPADSALLTTEILGPEHETIEPEEPFHVIALPERPAEVMDMLSQHRRRRLRAQLRQLQQLGDVAFRAASSRDLPESLAELVRLHDARWRMRGRPGALDLPTIVRFHERAAPELLRADLLRLDLLTLDGRVIAAYHWLRRGGVACGYINGFDPELARFGPGSILLAHVLEDAVRDGCAQFDFLRGREAYKYVWGGMGRPKWRKRIYRDGGARPTRR